MENRQGLLYGLMAEFPSSEELLEGARRAFEAGYRRMDAFAPFPVEGLSDIVGVHRGNVALITFIGGIIGCCGGFFLQWWPNVIGYPLNIGGKPYDSWPAFIPITFELTILGAALSATFGMIALNGLPCPYHPVFNVPRFALASQDRFFLLILAEDRQFEVEETQKFLSELNPREVSQVDT